MRYAISSSIKIPRTTFYSSASRFYSLGAISACQSENALAGSAGLLYKDSRLQDAVDESPGVRTNLAGLTLQISHVDRLRSRIGLMIGWYVFHNGGISLRLHLFAGGNTVEVHPDLHGLCIKDDPSLFADILV